MHRDANLGKRNALVIPGVLLAVWSLVGILYATAVRGDTEACGDGRYVELYYGCRDAALLLAVPLVLGLVLVAIGMMRFPNTSTCLLGHGTCATTGLALLISATALPLMLALGVYGMQGDTPYVVTSGDTDYRLDRLLGAAGFAGLLALGPYLALYVHQVRGHSCCHEASCFEPCFCDEPSTVPPAPSFAQPDWRAPETPAKPAWPERPESPPASAPATDFARLTPTAALQPWSTPPAMQRPKADARPAPEPRAAPAKVGDSGKTRRVRKTPAKKPSKK